MDLSADRNGHSSQVALRILKYVPALTLLVYAYLYLLGYFYLFFYFTYWGLNVHEMGFSIVDYATTAMYPNLQFVVQGLLCLILGLIFADMILDGQYHKKPINLKNPISWILIIPLLLSIVFAIIIERFLYIILGAGTLCISLYLGFAIGIYRKIKWPTLRNIISCLMICFLLSLLAFSGMSGINNAHIYRKYSYNLISFPPELNEIIIYSNEPLPGMEIYQTGSNKYEGLFLLAFKQDIYYLVPNLRRHEQFQTKIDKIKEQVDGLLKEVNDLQIKGDLNIGKNYTEQLGSINKKVNDLIIQAKTLPSDSLERANLLKEAKAGIKAFDEISSNAGKALSTAGKISELSKKN